MRVFSLRTALCLTLATLVASTAFAGVRGKPTKLKEPTPVNRRLAQGVSDYTGVNSPPVPIPADVNVTNETVIQETPVAPTTAVINDPACAPPATARTNTAYLPMMVMPMPMQMPMMTPAPAFAQMPMPMMAGYGCSGCGGGYRGLSPVAAAAYDGAFGPGLYRTGAEAGQYHFPYYSYRRPWYFPGQPSFQRSTDYVW